MLAALSRQLLLGSVRRGFFGTGLRRFWLRSAGPALRATFLRGVFFGAGFLVDFFVLGTAFLRAGFFRAFDVARRRFIDGAPREAPDPYA